MDSLPCAVCGRASTGYHYGAHTCGACKIFFKRNVDRTIHHKCSTIQTSASLNCPGCRIQLCFNAGMAIEASKKGRYSFKRKQEIIRQTALVSTADYGHLAGKCIEHTWKMIVEVPNTIWADMENLATQLKTLYNDHNPFPADFFDRLPSIQRTYHEYRELAKGMFSMSNVLPQEEHERIYHETGLDVDGRVSGLLERIANFQYIANQLRSFVVTIPGFDEIEDANDQKGLTQGTHGPIMVLAIYDCFNSELGIYTTVNGTCFDQEQMKTQSLPTYVEGMFEFSRQLKGLNLEDEELNLLKCCLFFDPANCATDSGREQTTKLREFYQKSVSYTFSKRAGPSLSFSDVWKVITDYVQYVGDRENCKKFTTEMIHRLGVEVPSTGLIPACIANN